jgi:hypothetical protein
MEHLIKCPQVTKEESILFIPEGHACHKSLETTELARMSEIVILTLPPHTAHKLQAHDIGTVGPSRSYMAQGLDLQTTKYPKVRTTDYDLASVIKNAFLSAKTLNNIMRPFA